jgi:hypothetical protein
MVEKKEVTGLLSGSHPAMELVNDPVAGTMMMLHLNKNEGGERCLPNL